MKQHYIIMNPYWKQTYNSIVAINIGLSKNVTTIFFSFGFTKILKSSTYAA